MPDKRIALVTGANQGVGLQGSASSSGSRHGQAGPRHTSAKDSIAGRRRMFSMFRASTGLRWKGTKPSANLTAGTMRSLKREYRCGRSLKSLAEA
jgi:hypothetical protein